MKVKEFMFDVLFVIFFFFTWKQLYAARNFTGASNGVRLVIRVTSFINLAFQIAYIVSTAIKSSVFYAVILLLASFGFVFVANIFISKIAMKRTQEIYNLNDDDFYSLYNYRCDVLTTVSALIGIIVNAIIVIVYIVNQII